MELRAHFHQLHVAATVRLSDRRVPAAATVGEVKEALGEVLPERPSDPADVIDRLVVAAEPGLVATPSGRFFGFVVGGTFPQRWRRTGW